MITRYFFHHLADGVEYLHSKGIAHMDLKPENFVLSNDLTLKICDFDLSYKQTDSSIRGKGSKYYRAPEVEARTCQDPKAADIYSMGIVLFVFYTRGVFPFSEEFKVRGRPINEVFNKSNSEFWQLHPVSKKKGA